MAIRTKLSPARTELFCEARKIGCSIKAAAARCGISTDTATDWLKRGEKAKSGPHREFYEADQAALGEFERAALDIIQQAAGPRQTLKTKTVYGPEGRTTTEEEATEIDWKAAAWLLERRIPEEYARLQKLEHTGKDGGPLAIREVVVEMPPMNDDLPDEADPEEPLED